MQCPCGGIATSYTMKTARGLEEVWVCSYTKPDGSKGGCGRRMVVVRQDGKIVERHG